MISWLSLAAACLVAATSALSATSNGLSDAGVEGRELARQICDLKPADNYTNTGVLRIFARGRSPERVSVRFETWATSTNWQTAHFAFGNRTNKSDLPPYPAAVLIIHRDNQPNEYRVWPISRPATETNEFAVLTGEETMIPFAGSDFWLADLGLDFFHWPAQKVLKHEIKRSQACKVLESTNPHSSASGYSRVVSWIDNDTLGIVLAEAYDAKGKLLKEFKPKDFKKVDGQYQGGRLEIRNLRNDSRSRLEFNLEKK